jgi:hypothetical protein
METIEERLNRTLTKEQREKHEAVGKKGKQWGKLSLNLEEHSLCGTPPIEILSRNPEKSVGENMTDKEIIDMLDQAVAALKRFRREVATYESPNAQTVLENQIQSTKIDMKYLENIGRLPEKYKSFDLDGALAEE